MPDRNALKVTMTATFQPPTEDELIEMAEDAGIDDDEPSAEELDDAYENWKTQIVERFRGGERPDEEEDSVDLNVTSEEVSANART